MILNIREGKLSWQMVIEIIFPKKFIHFMMKKVYGAIMEMYKL